MSKILNNAKKVSENSSQTLMLSILDSLYYQMKLAKKTNNTLYKSFAKEYERIMKMYRNKSIEKASKNLAKASEVGQTLSRTSSNPESNTDSTDTAQTDTCYFLLYKGDSLIKELVLPCYPEDLSSSMSANWSDTSIVGRSSPLTSYSNTNFTETSFSFTLRREMAMHFNETSTRGETADIENIIKYVQASVYPTYVSAGIKPTLATFKFGKHKIHGIIRSVSIKYDKPIINDLYSQVTISISMSEIPGKVFGVEDIVANNSYNIYNV